MKQLILIVLLVAFIGVFFGQAQISIDPKLEKEIIQSGIIHSPLPVDESNSYEGIGLTKKVLEKQALNIAEDFSNWSHSGYGKISSSKEQSVSGRNSLKMAFPTFTGKRAYGSDSDPDYAVYGHCSARLNVGGQNWEEYNRIVFHIYPDSEGARVVNLDFNIENHSEKTKAGYNRQSGGHLVQLRNRKWNTCFLDIDEYQRDNIAQIGLSVSLKGKDITVGDSVIYYIGKIELQLIDDPEIVSGWQPGENRVVYSTSGYLANGPKTAILNMDENLHNNSFKLIDAKSNQDVFSGKVISTKTTTGEFDILDFSFFSSSGTYRLKVGEVTTPEFRIDKNVWEPSLWRTMNFVFGQRCGYAVPGIHGECHVDLFSKHKGQRIPYSGGWHDAGDLSQQTLQTGDVAFNFFEAYNQYKTKNPALAARLLEEARWGLDFLLKNRYGDGYRASSMGLVIWQDGIVDSFDDITSVRVQNLPFDNFLYSAYEAYAALSIPDDPAMKEYLERVAKEDFEFALEQDAEVGLGGFISMYEHSYNTSESQYMATASWAASMLYNLTGDDFYAKKAVEFIDFSLRSQETQPIGEPGINGFFYRDPSKKVIVHYNHQSREQVYMQAMVLLCETQDSHPDYKKWKKSIELYGDYLKSLMPYTAPYGMLSSGVYCVEENQDNESFDHLHLFQPEDARALYTVQIKNGIQLDKEHYLKRFPVWFSIFNGNTAVHLSMGKAAVVCGKFLGDEDLKQIGLEQLYWVVGKNPFGQSLIYGEGWNYPQKDNFSSGLIVGEIPVGIRTLGNEDIPYWPQTNTSCYKEVWVTSAGKWISLASEF